MKSPPTCTKRFSVIVLTKMQLFSLHPPHPLLPTHKLVFFFQMCMHAWSDRACICVNIRTFITLCVRRVSECVRKSERKSAFLFFFLQLHDIIGHVSSEFIPWVQSKTEKVSPFSISRFVTTAPGRLTDRPTETETDS